MNNPALESLGVASLLEEDTEIEGARCFHKFVIINTYMTKSIIFRITKTIFVLQCTKCGEVIKR